MQNFKIKYIIALLLGIIVLAPVACNDTVKTKDKVTVDELLSNQAFQSFAETNKAASNPILKKIAEMEHGQVLNLSSLLNKKLKRLKGKKITTKTNEPEFEEVIKLMGYENASQYKNLITEARTAFKNFTKEYPEFKGLADKEKKAVFEKAMLAYYEGNEYDEVSNFKSSTPTFVKSCQNPAGVSSCLTHQYNLFAIRTAGCVAVGAFTAFIGGAICQALNIAVLEEEKQYCVESNC